MKELNRYIKNTVLLYVNNQELRKILLLSHFAINKSIMNFRKYSPDIDYDCLWSDNYMVALLEWKRKFDPNFNKIDYLLVLRSIEMRNVDVVKWIFKNVFNSIHGSDSLFNGIILDTLIRYHNDNLFEWIIKEKMYLLDSSFTTLISYLLIRYDQFDLFKYIIENDGYQPTENNFRNAVYANRLNFVKYMHEICGIQITQDLIHNLEKYLSETAPTNQNYDVLNYLSYKQKSHQMNICILV